MGGAFGTIDHSNPSGGAAQAAVLSNQSSPERAQSVHSVRSAPRNYTDEKHENKDPMRVPHDGNTRPGGSLKVDSYHNQRQNNILSPIAENGEED